MTERCGVVVGHGRFGEGLLSALSVVAGEQENLWAVSNQDRNGKDLETEIVGILAERRAGREAYLLCDMDGGSSGQACRRLLAGGSVRAVFFGVSLPLLVEFVFLQDEPFERFVENIVGKSRKALGAHR